MTVVCMTSIAMRTLNADSSLVILKPDERPLSWSQLTWEDFIDLLIKDYHTDQELVPGTLFNHKNNSTVLTDQGKANVLNSYFASVGVKDNGVPVNNGREFSDGIKLDSIDFTPDKLLKIMRNVK